MAELISAENVRKSLGGVVVLEDVSISLSPGSLTALMGRSGSGKTTLIRALAFIDPPDAGIITFQGDKYVYPRATEAYEAYEIVWPTITVVFQDLFLWPHLTCYENIRLPAVRRRPESGAETASLMAEKLGVSRILKNYPNQVSRGQRQLVALARALAVEPKVILLDEITASLDIETSAIVGGVLREAKAGGAAILVITHQFGFARNQADHFAYLDNGEIVEQGPPSILDHPETDVLRKFLRASAVAL